MTKILIVDDDKQATDLLQKILSSEGYETTAVNDSSKAVQIADSIHPNLIILDLMMPDPDGFKVCRMLRQIPSFIFTPIIIVTALDDTDSRVVAFGAGADDYLTKPFHIGELSYRVKDLLSKTE
jgi:DNA-binding response OmpR family regulator